MLAKKYRFHGHGSLKYLYHNGKSIRSKNISLKYVFNKFNKNPRISIVISKKVLKHAVDRNRARRRVYAAIGQFVDNFNGAYDIALIISSPEIIKMDFSEISDIINKQLKEANIIK